MVVVERGGSPTARWEAAARAPAAGLRSVVDDYEGYWEHSRQPVGRREVPIPRVVLIINIGDPLLVTRAPGHDGWKPMASFVAGLGEGATLTRHAGVQHGVEVRLTPLGAHRLLGMPMDELTDEVVGLADLWGTAGSELTERIAEAADWEARFDILDRVLARLAGQGPEPLPEILGAWERLERTRGDLAISELVSDSGWSRRRLAQRFREQVGLTPKSAAKVLRFQHAIELLARPGHRSLASVAVACGYYDQAHFNRDFRALAGCTPTDLLAARLADPFLMGDRVP